VCKCFGENTECVKRKGVNPDFSCGTNPTSPCVFMRLAGSDGAEISGL